MVPVHFGGHLRVFLDGCGSAGIDQRQRLRALDRCREKQARANRRKPEGFRSVHSSLLRFTGHNVSAAYGSRPQPPRLRRNMNLMQAT
jgi:hypothetical protein